MSEATRQRIHRGFDRIAVILGCATMGVSWIFSLMLIEDFYVTKRAETAVAIYDALVSKDQPGKRHPLQDVPKNGDLSEEEKSQRVLEAWTAGRLSQQHARSLNAIRKWTPKSIFVEICALAGGFLVGWLPVKGIGRLVEARC